MIGGVPTPIARSDMDEATWENVVEQSVKTVPSKVDGSPEVGAEAEASVLHEQAKTPRGEEPVEDIKKSIDWPQLMSLGQNLDHIDKSLVSDEEKGHLKGMSEWSRAEFLRERMRKHGYEVPKTSAEAERESFKKDATADNEGTEKPGAPDEKELPSRKGTGTQTEDDVHVGAADDVPRPGSVRGMMSSFAKDTALGALPSPAKSNADYVKEYQTSRMVVPQEATEVADAVKGAAQKLAPMEGGFPAKFAGGAPVTGGFPGLAGGDAGVAQANAKGEQHGAEDLATLRNISDAVNPINLARKFDQAVTSKLKPINDVFTKPSMSADEMDAQEALARRDPGVDYDPAFDATQPSQSQSAVFNPENPPPVETVPGSGSASLSASLQGGGGFTPAQVDPNAIKAQQQAQEDAIKAQRDAQARVASEGEKQRGITDEAAKIELNERQKADVLGALATETQMDAVKHAESWSAARMSAAQTAREAAANPIDPNRYWNNRGDGQRAAAVIAGALYGFTGQGMQWLQRIDGLVDADNRLQASDRASKVEGLNKYAAEMGQQSDDALKFGLSRAQAQLLARTQKLEGLKSQLDILTMRQTDSARAQQGAMMSAQLGQHIDQIASQGLQLAQQTAQMKSADRYHNAQLHMEKMGLQLKAAAAAAKGDGGEQLRGPQVQDINDIMDAIKSSKNMSQTFKNSASGFLSKIMALDPTGTTDAADYNARREVVVQLIGRALEGGKLAEGDIGRYLKMIPSAGDLRGVARWDQLQKELEQRLTTQIRGFKGAGFDVGDLPRQAAEVLPKRRSTEREVEIE
jgi:hypothetical protein